MSKEEGDGRRLGDICIGKEKGAKFGLLRSMGPSSI